MIALRLSRLVLGLGCALLVPLAVLAPQVASAKVAHVDERGFIIQHMFEVPAGVEETWDTILKPSEWWESKDTWSGDAANLSIDPKAGGCFCELLPNADSPRAAPRGSVEHMRVVYIEQPRVLRMTGALGPLQADAVNGTMTIQLKPVAGQPDKTQLLLEYVVGGYAHRPMARMAPAVDAMIGAQMRSLVAKLGGAFAQAFPSPEALEGAIAGEGGAGDEAASQSASEADSAATQAEEAVDNSAQEDGAASGEDGSGQGVEPLAQTPPEGEPVGR